MTIPYVNLTIPKGFRVVNFGAKYYANPEGKHPVDIDQTQGTQMDFEIDSLVNINDINWIELKGNIHYPYNATIPKTSKLGDQYYLATRSMVICTNTKSISLKPDIAKISPNNPGDMNNRLFVVTG